MLTKLKSLLLLFVLSSFLFSCLPALFTATTTSTVAVAKDRSVSQTMEDAKIATLIRTAFIKNNFRDLYAKINTDVINGRVLYTGTVDQNEDMITAVQIAWDQAGVKEVINELKVDKNSNHFDLIQFTRDTIITGQVKSKIFINRDVKFVNYTAITVNDVVYLFGIARSQEELEKVGDIASKVNGVKKVISHVKIREKKIEE